MCVRMRLYDCKGNVSDRNVRAWQVSMRGHGGSAHASMSYNVKRKSCNSTEVKEVQWITSQMYKLSILDKYNNE